MVVAPRHTCSGGCAPPHVKFFLFVRRSAGLDEALNALSRGLEQNRGSSDLWLYYLDLFAQRGERDATREMSEQAVTLAPSDALWWKVRGRGWCVYVCAREREREIERETLRVCVWGGGAVCVGGTREVARVYVRLTLARKGVCGVLEKQCLCLCLSVLNLSSVPEKEDCVWLHCISLQPDVKPFSSPHSTRAC